MSPRQQVKCRFCNVPVVFFRSPFTGARRTFDPKPVDATHPLAGVKAFPVLGGTAAYKPAELADLLQVQRQCSLEEAQSEVRDMPWHRIHECLPTDPEAGG